MWEVFAADFTLERSLSGMHTLVRAEVTFPREALATDFAHKHTVGVGMQEVDLARPVSGHCITTVLVEELGAHQIQVSRHVGSGVRNSTDRRFRRCKCLRFLQEKVKKLIHHYRQRYGEISSYKTRFQGFRSNNLPNKPDQSRQQHTQQTQRQGRNLKLNNTKVLDEIVACL